LEVHFANPELQRLYTDNVGANKYTAETVRLFRRRIRHIEAAKDLNDLQCPGGVQYKQLTTGFPRRSSLALNESWRLILSEEEYQGSTRVVVHEISETEGVKV
jgi:plasmid maintenance system killer protein